ncbi:hypothetical protein [Bacteroides thetaiotaomicron]|nr:hypothetical protein [Bacteroides thetaiotaomicron]
MASTKVKYRSSIIAGKEGTLYYQIIHNPVSSSIEHGLPPRNE